MPSTATKSPYVLRKSFTWTVVSCMSFLLLFQYLVNGEVPREIDIQDLPLILFRYHSVNMRSESLIRCPNALVSRYFLFQRGLASGNREQCQIQISYFEQDTMKRGLVGKIAGERGRAIASISEDQSIKPLGPALFKMPFDNYLVRYLVGFPLSVHRSSSVEFHWMDRFSYFIQPKNTE